MVGGTLPFASFYARGFIRIAEQLKHMGEK
jgi:hypothetical protein